MAAFIERHKRRAPLWWNFSAASLRSLYIVCIDGCIVFFLPPSIVVVLFLFSSAPGRTRRCSLRLIKQTKDREKIYTLVHTRWLIFADIFLRLPAGNRECDAIDGCDLAICVLDWLRPLLRWLPRSPSSAGQIFANARARINWKSCSAGEILTLSWAQIEKKFLEIGEILSIKGACQCLSGSQTRVWGYGVQKTDIGAAGLESCCSGESFWVW
jgi:hypothetical protein